MSDEPIVPWTPEPPTQAPSRDVNRLGPIGFVVVAIAVALAAVRLAGDLAVADSPYELGRALGYLLGPVILGAIVWAAIVAFTRRRTPGRRFLAGGLAVTIAVFIILAMLGRS